MHRFYSLSIFFILVTGCGTLGNTPKASVGEIKGKGPVADTMRANSHRFEACAIDSVSVQTGSIVKVQLRFKVNGSGNVISGAVEQMKDPDPDLHDCLLRALRKIRFQAPYDGQVKEITFPLTLKPS